MGELCAEVIKELYNREFSSNGDGRNETLKSIAEFNAKLSRARELLLNGDLDGSDFRLMKTECESKINRLEAKLAELSVKTFDITLILNKAIETLSNLASLYENGSISLKREIIGSMYPEKLSFDGTRHRTTRLNEVVQLIYQVSSKLQGKKIRASNDLSCLPSVAPEAGLEPATL